MEYPLLNTINDPNDLRRLAVSQLAQLSDEVRGYILEEVSKNPGHLGASLGAVELAVALHYAYNTPFDKLIWDVGHQAYAHKILTGRRENFKQNRKKDGLSGFPKMAESEYDAFGTGHASTSISAALGYATAALLMGNHAQRQIAVIGDGALTGGMAFEALNNAGVSNANLLVVLNDNGISIDENVGALKRYLKDIIGSPGYNRFRETVTSLLGRELLNEENTEMLIRQIDEAAQTNMLKHSNLFEALNFAYFGPVDGHDTAALVDMLQHIKDLPGPKLLHVKTIKGKGFLQAEQNRVLFHSPGLFDKNTGTLASASGGPQPPRYQDVFGETIIELATLNPKIVGVTPAMPTGSSLSLMMAAMPERTFDVGIAEQHAVTFSAGMAAGGLIPFCNIYSTFIQRAYDQVIHDVALQNLHVVFCLDRAGLVGEDGATHHGVFDIAAFRPIPGLTIASPLNEVELRNMMFTAQLDGSGPFIIRYPRGKGVMPEWRKPFERITIGKGRLIRKGEKTAILSLGHIGNNVSEALNMLEEKHIFPSHYDMRFAKPLDETLLTEIAAAYDRIITVEDGAVTGGFGSAVTEYLAGIKYCGEILKSGVPDTFIEQGTPAELQEVCGYRAGQIADLIINLSHT